MTWSDWEWVWADLGLDKLGVGKLQPHQRRWVALDQLDLSRPHKKVSFVQASIYKFANNVLDEDEKYARQKFGTQKGISSDEFFGKGAFDPNAQSEAKSRLQGFEGAQSISSNAYFGREDEPDGGEEYGDLETAAKDFVRKFGVTAGDDLDNLTQVLGEGATKLQGAIRSYLNG